jgi:outer membrane protein assembly factor BamD
MDSPESSLDQQSSTDAIKQFQLFVNKYPESTRVADCNKYIDELRFKLETKAYDNARLYYKMQDYKSAVVSLGNVVKDFPASIYREECLFLMLKSAHFYAGNSIETKKEERYKNAIEYYAKLLDAFPQSRYKKEAEKIVDDINGKLATISSKNG